MPVHLRSTGLRARNAALILGPLSAPARVAPDPFARSTHKVGAPARKPSLDTTLRMLDPFHSLCASRLHSIP